MPEQSTAKRLFLVGLRAHWLAQALLLILVLLQAIVVIGLVLEVARAAATGTADASWQAGVIRWARRISNGMSLMVMGAAGLDLLGSSLCLALRRPLITRVLVIASLLCKLAIPAAVILAASWSPLAAGLAPVLTIWLAWLLFCLALERLSDAMDRQELAEEAIQIMVLGSSILIGMAAVTGGVVYMMLRYEGAILLAGLAFVVYVILSVVFCTRYMNFLDGVTRIAGDPRLSR
jgi:hypothetical protein